MKSVTHPVLYPPTIIGHITEDISDLYKKSAEDKNEIRIHYGVQLNGRPHLGTAISILTGYAAGAYLQEKFDKPSVFFFGALENGPGEKKEVDGITYQKMLCDCHEGERTVADINLDSFQNLMEMADDASGLCHRIERYDELQAKPTARKTFLDMFEKEKEFVELLNPSDDRLRVRFPCPECRYEDKHAKNLKVLHHDPGKKLVLESKCFQHGKYKIDIEEENKDFFDVNTMIRNVMKEAVISKESEESGFFPLIIKGADWSHAAFLVSDALEMLGYDYRRRPKRLFVPMVEDWSGAKLSKSVYLKQGTYDKLEKEFLMFEDFMEKFGDKGFKALWNEIDSWVKTPQKIYRNYSIDGIKHLFFERLNSSDKNA